MAPIQRRNRPEVEPLSERDDRGVDNAQLQVRVLVNQRRDPSPIGCRDLADHQLTPLDRRRKRELGSGAETVREKVRDLGHDQHRNDERAGRAGEKFDARVVMAIAPGRGRIQRTGVDDQH